MTLCYCGSKKAYGECCGPIMDGSKKAGSPEILMRARYSAFCRLDMNFLSGSLHPEHRQDHDVDATRRWAENADWLGLKIVAAAPPKESEDVGHVEFIATFKEKGLTRNHHEKSEFKRHKGRWYFVDGDMVKAATQINEDPKVGRNDRCPCGSGKKYKKCCGAA